MRMVTYIRGYKGWNSFNHHKFIALKSASGSCMLELFILILMLVHKPL